MWGKWMIHREILSSPGQSCHCQPGKGEGATGSERPGPIQMLVNMSNFHAGEPSIANGTRLSFQQFRHNYCARARDFGQIRTRELRNSAQ
jgi:hypothetical protein